MSVPENQTQEFAGKLFAETESAQAAPVLYNLTEKVRTVIGITMMLIIVGTTIFKANGCSKNTSPETDQEIQIVSEE